MSQRRGVVGREDPDPTRVLITRTAKKGQERARGNLKKDVEPRIIGQKALQNEDGFTLAAVLRLDKIEGNGTYEGEKRRHCSNGVRCEDKPA